MRINFAFIVAGWLAVTFNAAAVDIQHWQTSQGTRVYYTYTEGLPLVDIQVTFDAGSARDGDKFGLSSFTSAMFDAGAGNWNADEIAERFANVGSQFNASSSIDTAWLSIRSLTDKPLLEQTLATLQTVLTAPTFPEPDFQRKKARTLAGLKHREESPGELANIAFYQRLYGDHPYAHPTTGFIKTVEKFTIDDVKSFYRRYYVAANAMVTIVGNVPISEAKPIAEKLVAGLPLGEKPDAIPPVKPRHKGGNQHIDFPSTQTHVISGVLGTYRNDPGYVPLFVGNHVLGGGGLVSQLFSEIREKRGLAYSAYSYFAPLYRDGPFAMGLQTRNDQTTQAVAVMKETLADFVANGPTEEELQAAKKNLTGGFAMRFDTNRELAEYLNMIGFYQLPLDYLDAFPKKINDVTREQIKEAFQQRVKPEWLQTITAGGKE